MANNVIPSLFCPDDSRSLHHDDAKRGWVVVSMKKDWKCMYPFDKRKDNGKMKTKNLIDIALGKKKSDLAIKNVNLKGATGYF